MKRLVEAIYFVACFYRWRCIHLSVIIPLYCIGVLEGSNVQVVEEMVDMITTQRAYEMNAKVVSAADDMLKYVSQSV